MDFSRLRYILHLSPYILQMFASWTTCVRVCFTSDLLSAIPCYFLMYAQLVPYIVVETSSFIFLSYTQEHHIYFLLLIGIYSYKYYSVSLCFTN